MAAYPALYKQWLDPKNDAVTMSWAIQAVTRAVWLAQHHPRIDAWDVAERFHVSPTTQKKHEIIQLIAESTPSGALLKAWYGLELTSDEIAKHPLAHSLYVHKHAPMYLEEVKQLPGSWEVAMALSTRAKNFAKPLSWRPRQKPTKSPSWSWSYQT